MTPGLRSLMRLVPRPLLERALEWQWRGRIPAWAIRLVRRSFRDADQTIRHGAGRGLRFNPGRANVAYALGISEPARHAKRNGLRDLLVFHQVAMLDHDPNVGGRFSALTNVGLLPASMLGLDIVVCTTARTDAEAQALLRAFNFPFRQ